MTVPVIVGGIEAVYANAAELAGEAEMLRDRGHWARAFALAHLSREELAKLPILLLVGVRTSKSVPVDWPFVRKLLNDHKHKWRVAVSELIRDRVFLHAAGRPRLWEEMATIAYAGSVVMARDFQGEAFVDPEWHEAVNAWGFRRFDSIYVDVVDGLFVSLEIGFRLAPR
jgi:AbiV family abortive infection protein